MILIEMACTVDPDFFIRIIGNVQNHLYKVYFKMIDQVPIKMN
jgi:hypothetical protein